MSDGSSATPPHGDALEVPASDGEAPAGSGFYHHLGRVEVWFTQASVVAMTLLVLVSAVSRTVGHPQSWTVEMATFSFAWAVFVGADVALRRDKMVTIDVAVERFSPRVRAWIWLVNSVLIALFLVAMVGLGSRLSYTTYDRTFSGLPWLSYSWVTIAVPIGCALMLYTMTHKIRDHLRGLRGVAS